MRLLPPPMFPRLARVIAVTSLFGLALVVGGCAARVAPRPPPPQAEGEVLLPPAEKPAELPKSIARPLVPVVPVPSAPAAEAKAPPVAPPAAVPTAAVPAMRVPGKVKIALLVPLTGPQAEIGAAMLEAAQMAVFDMPDDMITLLPRDTGATAEEAARAARSALDAGAQILLGPLLAPAVAAVAPIAAEARVPVVAFSNDRAVAGNGVYVMGLDPEAQVARVVSYAISQGRSRFAALVPDSAFGSAVVAALEEHARPAAAVSRVERYPQAGEAGEAVRRLADYDARHAALKAQLRELAARSDEVSRQALARLKDRDTLGEVEFDALLIPEGGERLRAIAALLPYYDIDPGKVQLLGTALWNDPTLGTEPALVGGWFAAPDPHGWTEFANRFMAVTGRRPPPLAGLGYDAAALAGALAHSQGGADFSTAALTSEQGFAGVQGIFRFLPSGVSEHGLAVLEMRRNEIRIISPAPESFPKLLY